MTRPAWHRCFAMLSAAALAVVIPGGARADDAEIRKHASAWHGSTLLFDQSATTQTLGVGGDYQSANPTYEWWVALKPRFFVYETKATAVALNLWANLYLELTNSDTTTRRREPLLGPTYLWATYTRALFDRGGWRTEGSIGPRATLPTDKAARNAGQVFGAGAIAGLSQTLPLRGKGPPALAGARVGINAIYNHPLSLATTPVNEDLRWTRQDVGGRPIYSDQLTGSMLVAHALNLAFSGEVQLLPRLSLSVSYVLLNAWTYQPRPSDCVVILTGCVQPIEVENPTAYRVNTWATAAVGYDIIDDLSLSVGYYNLASQLGRDGTYRNPLWSPSARFFVSLVGNLDIAYARITGRK